MRGLVRALRLSKKVGKRWTKPERIVLLVLFFGTLFRAHQTAAPYAGIDYYQFWIGGHAAWSQQSNELYTASGRAHLGRKGVVEALASRDPLRIASSRFRTVLETYSTPFLYTTFGALSSADYRRDLAIFRSVSLAAFVAATTLFARMLSISGIGVLAALALLLHGFGPLASDLRVGNVNCFQFFGIAVVAYILRQAHFRHREVLAGCVLGLLIAFKPNLVLVTPFLLFEPLRKRNLRQFLALFLGVTVGIFLAVTTSSLVFGSFECWTAFYTSLRAMPNEIIRSDQGNFAPLVLFARSLSYSNAAIFWLLAALIALVPLAMAVRVKRGNTEGTGTNEHTDFALAPLSLGCLFILLVPRLAWFHYFVLAVPAMLLTLTNPRKYRACTIPRSLFAAFVWFTLGLNSLTLFGSHYTTQQRGIAFISVVMILFFVTYASVLYRFRRVQLRTEESPTRSP